MAVTRAAAAKAAVLASRHPQCAEAFRSGLASALRQWTALELAVHNQWGGPFSRQRADELESAIFDMFWDPEVVYKDDIGFLLDEYMDENFSTVCEDGSTDEIGELLVDMFRKCATGDFSLVETVMSREKKRPAAAALSQGVDPDSDEDCGEDGSAPSLVPFSDAAAAAAGDGEMTLETVPEVRVPVAPIIDEDGFETVQRGTKKKGKK